VSSILTALRKLAEEKERGERDIAFPAGSLGRPDRQLYDKRKSSWTRVYVPVVMLMLLAGGWFGRAYFKEADMPLASQARKEAPPAQHGEQSAERPSNIAGAAEPVVASNEPVEADSVLQHPKPGKAAIAPLAEPRPVTRDAERSPEQATTAAASSLAPKAEAGTQTPVLAGNEPVQAGSVLQHPKPGKAAIAPLAEPRPVARDAERSPEQATTAAVSPLAPKAEVRTQTPAEAGAGSDESIPILHNAPLKVQALFWSTSPRKRVAVINNLVLKEGDDIESFQIVRIDPDAVIVTADGHLSRVRVGSK
jgi:hypothetical protein